MYMRCTRQLLYEVRIIKYVFVQRMYVRYIQLHRYSIANHSILPISRIYNRYSLITVFCN